MESVIKAKKIAGNKVREYTLNVNSNNLLWNSIIFNKQINMEQLQIIL